MKITVKNKKDLLDGLNKVHSVVEKKNTLQILSNILLSATGESLVIKATDLEVSMETVLPVQVLEEGKATVSAKNFLEIVRELPEKEINIFTKPNHWVGITCGKSTFNILGLSPEDYPSLPGSNVRTACRARSDVLRKMIDYTLFAVSNDETRYQMNGVYLEPLEGGKCRMAGTDGHRLSYYEDSLFEDLVPFSKGVIIPRKGIQEIRKVVDTVTGAVEFSIEGNHVLIKAPGTFLSVRLIEGQYPDYKLVIPKNNNRTMEIDRNSFADSLRRVSLLANEKVRGVKLYLTPGKLEVSSSNPEIGEATEIIETNYQGDPLEIGFNARYLQETLAVIDSPQVVFELNDRMSPGVIKLPHKTDYLSVMMPMRL